MRTIAVIPARGGSKRVPAKNLARLDGRTLVRRSLETVLDAGRIDAVALSSESDEILAEAGGLDVLRVRRPTDLATDTALSYDVAVHAVDEAERRLGRFDVVALVQCTTPFVIPDDIDGALELLERSGAPSVVTVTRAPDLAQPVKLKIMEGDRLLPYLEEDEHMRPSHELPELWVRNGAVYASRRSVLDEGILVARDVLGYRMPPERSVDINTPLDLAFAQFLAQRSTTT